MNLVRKKDIEWYGSFPQTIHLFLFQRTHVAKLEGGISIAQERSSHSARLRAEVNEQEG